MDETNEPASFEVAGFPRCHFVLLDFSETEGVRLAPRERPFRPGAKLDSTGTTARTFAFTALFSNDIQEQGVTDQGSPLYPDRLDELTALFRTTLTGTLNTPRVRGLRAKATNWTRSGSSEQHRGGELLTGTFTEDNEDSVDREAIVKPSARATLSRKVEEAQFDAEAEGIWDGNLASLTQLTSELIGLANTPGEYLGQVEQAGARVSRCVDEVRRNFETDSDGRGQFWDPLSFPVRMRLLEVEDLSASAAEEARRRNETLVRYLSERTTTIWRIATDKKQSAERLMEVNPQVEDFAAIPPRTPVWVFSE